MAGNQQKILSNPKISKKEKILGYTVFCKSRKTILMENQMRIISFIPILLFCGCSASYVDTGSKIPDAELSLEPSEPAMEPSEPTMEPSSEDPIDADGDGFVTGEDCDDNNPNIHPNQEEIPYDGVDNDCNEESKDDDLDGDGAAHTEDCDDDNEDIFPDAIDNLCDGIDNNCNDQIDEDFAGDSYEPNDAEAHWLGDLGGQQLVIQPFIFPETDNDRFIFYAEDGFWPGFGVGVYVTGVSSSMDVVIDLIFHGEQINSQSQHIASSNEEGLGGSEEIEYGGGWFSSIFSSDTGWYEVKIRSRHESSCSQSYTLTINPDL